MNAPENCGRAPPQVCAGGVFGPQAKPSPAGDGFSGLRPLAPAAPGRPAARPSPCGNSIFTPNTFRIIQSNLYSFRQISRPLPFGRSASLAKARIHRAKFVQKAARPLLHRLCARPRNRGAAPSGLSYTYCILLSNYTDIRQNPPAVLRSQMPCIIFAASKLRGTIRRKKIKNNIVNDGFAFVGKEDASQREGLSR